MSYAPNPRARYKCPYCNESAVLSDAGVVVDSYQNVVHLACFDKEVAPNIAAQAPAPVRSECKYGDPFCPCQDGDTCHYEGNNPMTVPIPVEPGQPSGPHKCIAEMQIPAGQGFLQCPICGATTGVVPAEPRQKENSEMNVVRIKRCQEIDPGNEHFQCEFREDHDGNLHLSGMYAWRTGMAPAEPQEDSK